MKIILSKNEDIEEVILDFDCFPMVKEEGKHLCTMLLRKYPKKLFVKENVKANFKNILKNLNKKQFNMKLIKEIMKDKVVMDTFDGDTDKIIRELFNSNVYCMEKGGTICITRNINVGSVHELDIKETTDEETGKTQLDVTDNGISKVMEKYPDCMYGYDLER